MVTTSNITIGCRVKLTKTTRTYWKKYLGHECLVNERSGNNVGLLVLPAGTNIRLDKKDPRHETFIAWVPEEDLYFIDNNIHNNIDFIDFIQRHDTDFCPNCNAFNLDFKEEAQCKGCGYANSH